MLITVRHGQSEFNAGKSNAFNTGITAYGTHQAKNARKALLTLDLSGMVIMTSPYLRCLQTVSAMGLNLPTSVKWVLGERASNTHRAGNCYVPSMRVEYAGVDWGDALGYDYGSFTEESHLHRLNDFVKSIQGKRVIVVSHRPVIDILSWVKTGVNLQVDNCEISML